MAGAGAGGRRRTATSRSTAWATRAAVRARALRARRRRRAPRACSTTRRPAWPSSAPRAAAACGLTCWGADFLLGPDGPVLIDLNAFPGYRSVDEAPGLGRRRGRRGARRAVSARTARTRRRPPGVPPRPGRRGGGLRQPPRLRHRHLRPAPVRPRARHEHHRDRAAHLRQGGAAAGGQAARRVGASTGGGPARATWRRSASASWPPSRCCSRRRRRRCSRSGCCRAWPPPRPTPSRSACWPRAGASAPPALLARSTPRATSARSPPAPRRAACWRSTGSYTALWVVVVVLAAVPLWVVWGFVHELPDRPATAPVDGPARRGRSASCAAPGCGRSPPSACSAGSPRP